MKKFLILISSIILTSCITKPTTVITCEHCTSPFDHKFEVGDCVKFNPKLLEKWQYSEGIIMHVEAVGIRSYTIKFKHPAFDKPTVLYYKFKAFDEEYLKTACEPILEIPHGKQE